MSARAMTLELTPIVEGNPSGPTLVFVQGWPDDHTVWDRLVARLSPRYRCVRLDMPGYGADRAGLARGGYRTEEIVEALASFVRAEGRGKPVTLILHDWGCYWGHAMHNREPSLADRVVSLDVAPHYAAGPKAMLGIAAYQSWLALGFALGGALGDRMTRFVATAGGAPLPPERIHAGMNYPYRNVWGDLASGRVAKNERGYWPEMPLLFVYGKDKPFPFHSKAWLDHLERTGGEVVGLDCGHWVQQHPDFDAIVERFLARTEPSPS